MNYGPLIFLAAFFALAGSWSGFVLTPQLQIGRLQQTNTIGSATTTYPVARPGLAQQGLEVYRANGCAYCHSQQVGQTRTLLDIALTDAGTNQAATIAALLKLAQAPTNQPAVLTPLPPAGEARSETSKAPLLSGALSVQARSSEVLMLQVEPADGWCIDKSRHMQTFSPEAPGGSSLYLANSSANPWRARR